MKLDVEHIYRYNNGMLERGNNVMHKESPEPILRNDIERIESVLTQWLEYDGTIRDFAHSIGLSHSSICSYKSKYLNGDYGEVDKELVERLI